MNNSISYLALGHNLPLSRGEGFASSVDEAIKEGRQWVIDHDPEGAGIVHVYKDGDYEHPIRADYRGRSTSYRWERDPRLQ